ncbi:MAG: helix-turn-helix transcriptional regulator [Firmicutes bacterium]|nr:helix-turn-helix transcriptional regulator [Bacillota bacterium]
MELLRMGIDGLHEPGFQVSRPNGYPHYLFLLIKTPAVFIINNQEFKANRNSVIIYDINSPHHYYADQGHYINDWIHFHAYNGQEFFKNLHIPLNTLLRIYDDSFIYEMLKLIAHEYYSVNTKRQQTMNLLLQAMFVKLSEVISKEEAQIYTNPHYGNLIKLRKEIYSNPQMDWTVSLMAGKLNLCNAYLQKIYKETFGVSCIADVVNSRIEYAKEILAETTTPINKIASLCGYNNDVHFMRQFKKYVGVTPTDYRRHTYRA